MRTYCVYELGGLTVGNQPDCWIFAATIFAGILSAIATWVAVVYTNKKTVENYKKDMERQRKENAMVIIKPMIKATSFWGLRGCAKITFTSMRKNATL